MAIEKEIVMEQKFLTKTDLRRMICCPGYVIDYLNDCGRLPVVQLSKGKGYPTKYDPKAIDIIKKHLGKQLKNDNNI